MQRACVSTFSLSLSSTMGPWTIWPLIKAFGITPPFCMISPCLNKRCAMLTSAHCHRASTCFFSPLTHNCHRNLRSGTFFPHLLPSLLPNCHIYGCIFANHLPSNAQQTAGASTISCTLMMQYVSCCYFSIFLQKNLLGKEGMQTSAGIFHCLTTLKYALFNFWCVLGTCVLLDVCLSPSLNAVGMHADDLRSPLGQILHNSIFLHCRRRVWKG